MRKVDVIQAILSDNNAVAEENRKALDAAGVFGINVMASPGAGKTSLILATAARLPDETKLCVVEGDLASSIDAELIAEQGIPVVQINTGGGCHLDAAMIRSALPRLPLDEIQLLMVENVGNLVCPANFLLGTHLNVVVASTPEGHDKPFKYPGMFNAARIVLINKFDLSEVFDFDLEYFSNGVRMLNPDVPIIPISCRTGAGMDAWVAWLLKNS
ncbi:MAG: hydrogenase accessory protein HypB [Candidatus Viridilinea halotolerans]|uniref:Hydrogenase accessory protein HypB n=1 Tax=Candidatus Viridilinea halotolerans TaxID=2491704 RepID=A0A426TSQ5_9CHLR|nr:MAG: hydrogenase accessory protein HypB [Candidatus Viridilinea halotolerans]